MSMKKIYLIRHAQSMEQSGESQDGVDPPLSALGREQAATLRQRLCRYRFDAVYISPLTRAWQTFELAGANCVRAAYDSRLIEIDWRPGWYEKMVPKSLVGLAAEDRQNAWQVPVYERAASFIEEMSLSEHELIGVFGHQGMFRCLFEVFFGLPYEAAGRSPILMKPDNVSLSLLGIEEGGVRLARYWNDFHHAAHLLT